MPGAMPWLTAGMMNTVFWMGGALLHLDINLYDAAMGEFSGPRTKAGLLEAFVLRSEGRV